jgi:sterol desaturase/sphingolipid hydroxylase (fatty acid hydroxylase superfamily)
MRTSIDDRSSLVYTTQMTWHHAIGWLFHSTQLRAVAHATLRALAIGIVFYFILYLLERASGGSTDQYGTRGFLQDVAYWFYYHSGLHQLLFMAALFSFLTPKLAFLQFKMVTELNPVARGALWFLVADFTAYWVHRLQHASRFVWAFHSTHHAQEQLSFATTTRFHPVDHFISYILSYVPLLMLGASPRNWLPFYLATEFLGVSQHSRIKWRLGVLSKVLVTPWFHSFHHSSDPRHYNKNFGAYLCVWDRLFGTAVDAPERPTEYGLRDIKMPTLLSTLIVPFRLLRQMYSRVSPDALNQVQGTAVISRSAEAPPDG